MTDFQSTLFDEVTVTPEHLTTEQRWERFLRFNGWFMPRLAELAYGQRLLTGRVSTKALFEAIRPEVEGRGGTYGLNNSFTSLAADRLIELYPDLESAIERRRRKS